MNKEMFNELLESIEQAGEIKKNQANASRTFKIKEPDVVAIREKYRMTQQEFSSLAWELSGIGNKEDENPKARQKFFCELLKKRPKAILESLPQ